MKAPPFILSIICTIPYQFLKNRLTKANLPIMPPAAIIAKDFTTPGMVRLIPLIRNEITR